MIRILPILVIDFILFVCITSFVLYNDEPENESYRSIWGLILIGIARQILFFCIVYGFHRIIPLKKGKFLISIWLGFIAVFFLYAFVYDQFFYTRTSSEKFLTFDVPFNFFIRIIFPAIAAIGVTFFFEMVSGKNYRFK